jgi:hypothetical protein
MWVRNYNVWSEHHRRKFRSRISIDVTRAEHQKLRAMAALNGKFVKEYVIERTLGTNGDGVVKSALEELESLLDDRLQQARAGLISPRTVGEIFKDAYRAAKRK